MLRMMLDCFFPQISHGVEDTNGKMHRQELGALSLFAME
jgi:hypothetical protein